MAVQYLGNGAPDGTACVQAGEKLSIFGNTTPVVKPTHANQALVTSTGVANANDWECAQLASMKSHLDDINNLVSALQVGLVGIDALTGS
jgi:hypothetical protein